MLPQELHKNQGNANNWTLEEGCRTAPPHPHPSPYTGVHTKWDNIRELTLAASSSLIITERSCPFSSKNTSRKPFLFRSPWARVLMDSVFPFSMLTWGKQNAALNTDVFVIHALNTGWRRPTRSRVSFHRLPQFSPEIGQHATKASLLYFLNFLKSHLKMVAYHTQHCGLYPSMS